MEKANRKIYNYNKFILYSMHITRETAPKLKLDEGNTDGIRPSAPNLDGERNKLRIHPLHNLLSGHIDPSGP